MRAASALLFGTLVCSAMLGSDRAASQALAGRSQLVGSWVFVSGGSKLPDGKPVWGNDPKGLLIFMENGRYSSLLMRGDLPKFVSGSRIQGTPEENAAIVRGSIASFGTYTVDEGKKTFTIRWEANTFPNSTGQTQTRAFTINGDELRIANPAPTVGGPPSELVYRRDK
jgi:hypothetical protein